MDYRDWGYDSRGPRERRSADDVRPQSWDYTGEISGLERRDGARRSDLDGTGGYPSRGSSSYSSGSIYRGRRRQQDDAVAEDRPYGRRSARTRWQQGEEDSTGTFSRYEEPDDRGGRQSSGWASEVAPTSGWTPSAAPTSGWVGAASTSEWTREAYTGEWTRGDFTGEWHRDTGEPIMPPRSESAGRGEPGGRRRAAPDWRELPEEPAGYDRTPAVPPQRDSFTDTSEWVPPVGEETASRPRRPDWAVGLDPSSGGGRRRRSWQDQAEARWPSTRSDSDRVEEPSGSWSTSAPVSGVAGAAGWSGRGDEPVSRRSSAGGQRPDPRLSDDDPRWVGVPSSAPRSPAVAFPDEGDFDYDDRPGARGAPATYRDGDLRAPATRRDDTPTTYRATAAPRARAEAPPSDWRAPTEAPDSERGRTEAPAADWRTPTAAPTTERARTDAPATDWRAPTAAPDSERGRAEAAAAPTDWRAPTAAPVSERGRAEAPASDWRTPTAPPATERARTEAPAAGWRAPTAAPGSERGRAEAPDRTARAAGAGWRAPTAMTGSERAVAQAPSPARDWRSSAADNGRARGLGAAVRRVTTPDELEDEYGRTRGGVFAAVVATLAWYAVPLLLFAVYTLFQGEESQVLGSLSGGVTRFGAALAVSLVVAVLLRWVSNTWRAISVGLAAAVVGGGLSTVLLSAISGQPLGG
ncbi:hypothetical protein RB614_21350 [Phytohabitans sp. ZYX-F-186]|uniref:Uncharacterized protein n=1 Tax=Phytohabitans maris TaxID=3071409 RepID=A0ABU0ZJ38_9ACTN|nr:hypothetical protein [Phytohabitans sp. ZYX-F-186]MDQ7907062.1 hypothetical protein [Phytohabitans sp. ZYX-F-186]